MSACSYCKWKRMKQRDPKATLVAEPHIKGRGQKFPDGMRVIRGDGRQGYWMGALANHCVCNDNDDFDSWASSNMGFKEPV